MRGRGAWTGLLCAAGAVALLWPEPAGAQQGGSCLTADLPPVTKPAQALRFGITPRLAGSAGLAQQEVAPVDEAAIDRALTDLRPPDRDLVLRLNRLFWADGDEGIARFAAMVDRWAALGLRSEIQVRYHPPEGKEGDIAAWEAFVRRAVRELGTRPAVAGFSITNEANLPISPNTSDGAYEGVVDALVRGVVAAREELVALGRPGADVSFNVMWRWSPDSDARFWTEIGQRADANPAFRDALTAVGLQVYPGLVWPPAIRPGTTAGEEVVEALTLVRRCYMPKAGLGERVQLWVSENGYATNLGRSEPSQAEHLDSTVRAVHRWSGELGVTDYRYFNLRDNNSDGTDLFAAVGLLRDDHTAKPAFATMRGLIGLFGADAPAATQASSRPVGRVRWSVAPRRDLRGARRFTVRGRLVPPRGVSVATACRGRVSVRYKAGRRTLSVRRARLRRSDCTFRSRVAFTEPVRFAGRSRLRVLVRFHGNRLLRAANAGARTVRVR